MARHPAASVFAVTILDDAVRSVLSDGHDRSEAINRIDLFKSKIARLIKSAGVKDYWCYGSMEYEVKYPSQYSLFVRQCMREWPDQIQPDHVLVPHVHLVVAMTWPNGSYLTGVEIAELLTGGGRLSARSKDNFHRLQQVIVQPIKGTVETEVPKLIDYGMKFRLRGDRGSNQTYHPDVVIWQLALLFDGLDRAAFFIDLESAPAKLAHVLPQSARKSPLLLKLWTERVRRRAPGTLYDPETGEVLEDHGNITSLVSSPDNHLRDI
jgi:hypothetical protein